MKLRQMNGTEMIDDRRTRLFNRSIVTPTKHLVQRWLAPITTPSWHVESTSRQANVRFTENIRRSWAVVEKGTGGYRLPAPDKAYAEAIQNVDVERLQNRTVRPGRVKLGAVRAIFALTLFVSVWDVTKHSLNP